MEIAAEFNFLPSGGPNAVLIGEMTVTEAEQQQVIDRLQRGGVETPRSTNTCPSTHHRCRGFTWRSPRDYDQNQLAESLPTA